MSASSSAAPLVFGLVVLDLQKRELTRKGRARPLRPTSFDVLAYLAANAGRIISTDELTGAVWPGRPVSPEALAQCLGEVRQALHTDARVIRAIPGQGYRFEAEVRRADPGTDPYGEFVEKTDAAVQNVTSSAPSPAGSKARVAWWLAAAALVFAAGAWMVSTPSLPPAEARRPAPAAEAEVAPQVTLNTQVVQLMVTGNDAAAKQTPVELRRARTAYEQAVKADPRYAPAYGALANTLAALAALAVDQPKELLPVADAYARRAIGLDPNHPLGWSALAQAHVYWTRNWVGAEAGYRRALALDPDTPSAAANLALLLAALNRPSEALEQSRTALQLDLESPGLQTAAGMVHALTGRGAEALPYFDTAQRLQPAFAPAAVWQASTLAQLGRHADALAAAQRARTAMGNAPVWVEGYVHATAGRGEQARSVLQSLQAHAQKQYVPATEFAFLHLALGDQDSALSWLERGVDERSPGMELLAVDPKIDGLRGLPRFKAVLASLKLPVAR